MIVRLWQFDSPAFLRPQFHVTRPLYPGKQEADWLEAARADHEEKAGVPVEPARLIAEREFPEDSTDEMRRWLDERTSEASEAWWTPERRARLGATEGQSG